ncbi:ACT domain-containing protein [Deinococcus sp. QL22]|uniref:ACT domain-containing protein n=1 Tax=Deinococcus sp. QL22 TaxID=2939437 RepID=UPI002016F814|nr:ACT domain-containing protein [Deinococcus sp. QL22]UQN06711.1 ACT domain-containing protein [Deinococcus sp. QL22]
MTDLTSESPTLALSLLTGQYVVAQLTASSPVPAWAVAGTLWAIVGAPNEVSVVTAEENLPSPLPHGLKLETGWAALRLHGPFPFHLTGILAAVLNPLKEAGVGIFALSTFDTDYVLVKAEQVAQARAALEQAGHSFKD